MLHGDTQVTLSLVVRDGTALCTVGKQKDCMRKVCVLKSGAQCCVKVALALTPAPVVDAGQTEAVADEVN